MMGADALDKAEVRRILTNILNDCTDMDTYRGLGELIDAIAAGDLDLSAPALIAALQARTGTEYIDARDNHPGAWYAVAAECTDEHGETFNRAVTIDGPYSAIVVREVPE